MFQLFRGSTIIRFECTNLLYNFSLLRTTRTVFQRYHLGYFLSFAMQNFRRLFIFSRVFKPDTLVREFQKEKSWDFLILLTKYRLNLELFMNI